jgi:hypothetical protein
MTKAPSSDRSGSNISAQPRLRPRAREIQSYGTVRHRLPLGLEEPLRLQRAIRLVFPV